MLLCATSGEGDNRKIALLTCPNSANPGDKVLIEGFEKEEADERLNP